MIPISNDQSVPSPGSGALLFHVIADDHKRIFSIDGPDGPNGVRLHARGFARTRQQKVSSRFRFECNSQESAIVKMQKYFPGYTVVGTWASLRSK